MYCSTITRTRVRARARASPDSLYKNFFLKITGIKLRIYGKNKKVLIIAAVSQTFVQKKELAEGLCKRIWEMLRRARATFVIIK